MREVGEASDGGKLLRISTACLPSTAPTIIDVKMVRRALYTALLLRAMAMGGQHALTRTCNGRGTTKDKKVCMFGVSYVAGCLD